MPLQVSTTSYIKRKPSQFLKDIDIDIVVGLWNLHSIQYFTFRTFADLWIQWTNIVDVLTEETLEFFSSFAFVYSDVVSSPALLLMENGYVCRLICLFLWVFFILKVILMFCNFNGDHKSDNLLLGYIAKVRPKDSIVSFHAFFRQR